MCKRYYEVKQTFEKNYVDILYPIKLSSQFLTGIYKQVEIWISNNFDDILQ